MDHTVIDSESSDESDDGLSRLIGRVSSTSEAGSVAPKTEPVVPTVTKEPAKITTTKEVAKASNGTRKLRVQSKKYYGLPIGISTTGDNDDDMGLIVPPKGAEKVSMLVNSDQQIKMKLQSKDEALHLKKQKLEMLRAQLSTELNDNGVDSEHQAKLNHKLIEKSVNDGSDILAYNRSFFYFGSIPINDQEEHLFGLRSSRATPAETIFTYKLRKSPFESTNVSFLRQVDSYLAKLINDGFKPTNECMSQDIEDSLHIVQDINHPVKLKLQHITKNPLVGLLRTSIFIKWHILDSTVDDRVIKHFLYAMCDSNLICHHYPDLLQLASLFTPLTSHLSKNLLQTMEELIRVTVYTYENIPSFFIDKALIEFKYHILTLVLAASVDSSRQHTITCIGQFMNYDSLTNFSNRILQSVTVSARDVFEVPRVMAHLYQMHYNLRLLNHLLDYDFDPKELKYVADQFELAKKACHKLMGDVSFTSGVEDKYDQKLKVVQVLEENHSLLDYFHIKFYTYYSSLADDHFYQ